MNIKQKMPDLLIKPSERQNIASSLRQNYHRKVFIKEIMYLKGRNCLVEFS